MRSVFCKLEAFKHSTFVTLRTFGSISFKEMKPVFSVSSSPQILMVEVFPWEVWFTEYNKNKHKEMHTSGNIMTSLHLATSNNQRPSQPWTFASFPWSPSAGNDDWTHLGDPKTSRRKVGITVKVRMDEWTNIEILKPFGVVLLKILLYALNNAKEYGNHCGLNKRINKEQITPPKTLR